MHGQFACSLVSKLGVSLDGVPDQFETEGIGRAEDRWRSHHFFLFSRACSLATELPDDTDGTPFSASRIEEGHRMSGGQCWHAQPVGSEPPSRLGEDQELRSPPTALSRTL